MADTNPSPAVAPAKATPQPAPLGDAPSPRLPWHVRGPWLTMALNMALIITIFLTRDRWAAWVVDYELAHDLPGFDVSEVIVSPDGDRLVLGGVGVALIDMEGGRPIAVFGSTFLTSSAASLSPQGRRLLVNDCRGDHDCRILVDTATGTRIRELSEWHWDINDLCFSADGRLILGRGMGERVCRAWDARDGGYLAALSQEKARADHRSDPHHPGREAALATAVMNCSLQDSDMRDTAVALSPDGSRLVAPTPEGNYLGIWDTATGERLLVMDPAHAGDLRRGRHEFMPDGERVLVSGCDPTFSIWDSRNGGELVTISPLGRSEPQYVCRAYAARDDRIFVDSTTVRRMYRRIRPEQWWGVFWLPHLYLIAALAAALIASGWRDLKRLRAL